MMNSNNFYTQNSQPVYQQPQPTSKFMNWMKNSNDTTAQQLQQQQQQQQQLQQQQKMQEYYRLLELQKQKAEWLAKNATALNAAQLNQNQVANNLWMPAYRRESPTSNWSSPSPPLGSTVPPGFEQQYQPPPIQQPINPQPNHQQMTSSTTNGAPQMMQAYDPFKSWSAGIWESGRNDNNEQQRESWNQ